MVVGDFYTGDVYPSRFQNQLFYTDYGEPTFRSLEIFADGSVQRSNLGAQMPGAVEMTMGPDGLIYYADNISGRIGRMQFTPTNTASALMAAQGDFDYDGDVDGNDFLSFQRNVGEHNVGMGALGDDAVVGDDELLMFVQNYGNGTNNPINVAAAQSEPTSGGRQSDNELYWLAYEEPMGSEEGDALALMSPKELQFPTADTQDELPMVFGVDYDLESPVVDEAEVVDDAFEDWDLLSPGWIGQLV